jgi:hypothetical protein
MQPCDINTKINKTYYKLFSLNISILRMGASGLGQVGRWAGSTFKSRAECYKSALEVSFP